MSLCIDLNADLGEGCGDDEGLMQIVTSCNIACGGHYGNVTTMRDALGLACKYGVSAGAHPSYPDRVGFGRTPMGLSGEDLRTCLFAQIQTLSRLAEDTDWPLRHVKPHGALYNGAAKDLNLALDVATSARAALPDAVLVGPPDTELAHAAHKLGMSYRAEGFIDRAYEASGYLRARSEPGALLVQTELQCRQALDLAIRGQVMTYDGSVIAQPVQTLCVHGDSSGALAAARIIRQKLEQEGVRVCLPD